jgi:hypothetical protein
MQGSYEPEAAASNLPSTIDGFVQIRHQTLTFHLLFTDREFARDRAAYCTFDGICSGPMLAEIPIERKRTSKFSSIEKYQTIHAQGAAKKLSFLRKMSWKERKKVGFTEFSWRAFITIRNTT